MNAWLGRRVNGSVDGWTKTGGWRDGCIRQEYQKGQQSEQTQHIPGDAPD